MSIDATLLTDESATGEAVAIQRGVYTWMIWGTWDTASATLEISPDEGTTWLALNLDAVTADGGVTPVELPACHARAALASAGGSTSLSSKLGSVG